MSQENIHEVVKGRYGAIAESVGAGKPAACCGSDAGCCDTSSSTSSVASCNTQLYDQSLLEGLPVDVTSLSLGCGDPVSIASLKAGEVVVDLGSGGGIDCFMAAKQVGTKGHVIGVDMTPAMLERANANKAKMGVQNVEFRRGQIEAMPIADATADVIMSNCVINLSPDKSAVFKEAYRVLKPGGRVSISDIVTDGEFSAELRAQTDKWAECVTGAIDASVYMGLMRDAGFVDIQIVDKNSAEAIIPVQNGMPRIFSARITARKI